MARIYLLTVHQESDKRATGGYVSLKENAAMDRFKIHALVNNPEEADLILFVEIDTGRLCEYVLRHPLVKKYRAKCFMFSTDFRVIPFLPGIYTSLEKSWYLPNRSRSGFYLKCSMNPLVCFEPKDERDLLYSFMGDVKTHPVRQTLAALSHPRGSFVDTSSESQAVMWRGSEAERRAFWNRYVELARRSKFILCPRGLAPSSIRLFEAMCMGRVPVILSDDWLPPDGLQWHSFALHIPERNAREIPRILEEKEAVADVMGLRARTEWEAHFAPEVVFHRVVEQCLEIRRGRKLPEILDRVTILPQLLRPRVLKEFYRALKQRIKGEKF